MTEQTAIPSGSGDEETVADQVKLQQPANPQDGPPPSANARKEAADKAATDKAALDAEAADAIEAGTVEDEDVKDGKPDDDAELDKAAWGDVDTSDEVTYSTLQLLQNSGVKPEEAKAMLWDAVQAGDPTKIDRDALVEKVGKAKATLILSGVNANIQATKDKIKEVSTIVHEASGGEAAWVKARTWAAKNIPESELEEFRGMLDKGGNTAKFAAREIISKYNADPKNTSLNASGNTIKPGGKGGSKLEPMTRREYGLALDKLANRRGTESQRAELLERRKLGKAKGI